MDTSEVDSLMPPADGDINQIDDFLDNASPDVDGVKVKQERPNIASFLNDARLFEPDLLAASIGHLLYPHVSLWDVLVQKMK